MGLQYFLEEGREGKAEEKQFTHTTFPKGKETIKIYGYYIDGMIT